MFQAPSSALPSPPKRLLDQARDAARFKQFSYRTEQCYVNWIRRFILFHHKRHPKDMGAQEVPGEPAERSPRANRR